MVLENPSPQRRDFFARGATMVAATTLAAVLPTSTASAAGSGFQSAKSSLFTTQDGTSIYYKDWGSGPVVVLSHGWPLTADSWEAQMYYLATHGFRVIAHDRRGHGRSSQPSFGNNMDTYADDLAQLIDHLDLKDAALVGFSTGGGEVARYIGKYGTSRVSKAGLISAVPPLMLQTPANPDGTPKSVFDGFRQAFLGDRSQFFLEVAGGPFFGYNRPDTTPSQGAIQAWWQQGMMGGFLNTFECIAAFSETDFTEDLKRFDIPTLIIHGDDDQVVPILTGGAASAQLIPHAIYKVYPGAPHGITETHKDMLNKDLLLFLTAA